MTVATHTGRLLRRLVRVSCAAPWLTLALAVALGAVAIWYTLTTLTLATSTRALLPRGLPFVERYVEFDRQFGELDDLVIVVEATSLPEAKVYATRLVQEIRTRRVPLGRVAYRVDPRQFEGRALLYLSTEKLNEIRDKVFDYQEFVETFAARPTLDQLLEGLATQIANAFAVGFLDLGLDRRQGEGDLKFIEELVDQMATRLERPAPYRSPWGAFFSVDADEGGGGYFLSDDQRLLFILAEPASESGSFTGNQQSIAAVRKTIAALAPDFPHVRVGVTGKPALSSDEMAAAFRDSERATVIAFALTLGLLVLAFLRVGRPLLMLTILAVSLAWSLGVATLVVGHLSLFSVMFISIVIGIGIDYGIYVLFRYEEELFLGRPLREALEVTAARSGPGTLLGAVTAAGTFYVLMLTDFRGLQELGFIAGSAILLSWVSMMTVFPAALVIVDSRHEALTAARLPRTMALERVRVPLVDLIAGHPRTVLALAALVTAVSLWGLRWVRFDYNLLNLQAEGTESVEWERKILATAHRSGFAALAGARSLEELRARQAAFSRLPSVSEVDSALLVIPADQEAKVRIIRDLAPIVGPVRVGRPLPLDLERLTGALQVLRRRLDIAAREAPAGGAKGRLGRLVGRLDALLGRLGRGDREAVETALGFLQQQLYRDFVRSFQRLQANLNPRPIGLDDLPPELRRKFVSDRGLFLLQIHPAIDIWDRQGAERFVTELRTVDPDVTGTPVITYEVIHLMARAAGQGTAYAVVLVALITALTLRRPRETVIALVPLGLGLVWTLGLIYFFDLRLTLGNVFGLPLLLGAAAEFGSNVVLRFMEGQAHGGPLVARSTVMAVLVNGLTTIAGFGSLMIARHRGVFGLGLLLTIGTIASLVAALIVLPVLLRLVAEMRSARRARRRARGPGPTAAELEEARRPEG